MITYVPSGYLETTARYIAASNYYFRRFEIRFIQLIASNRGTHCNTQEGILHCSLSINKNF